MTHRFNVNFSGSAWTEIEQAAEELDISHSEVIREALSMFVFLKNGIRAGDDFLRLHAGDDWPMVLEMPYFERLRTPRPPRKGIMSRLFRALQKVAPELSQEA